MSVALLTGRPARAHSNADRINPAPAARHEVTRLSQLEGVERLEGPRLLGRAGKVFTTGGSARGVQRVCGGDAGRGLFGEFESELSSWSEADQFDATFTFT